MDIKRIEELIGVLEGSRAEELTVRKGELSVHIRKGKKDSPASRKQSSQPVPSVAVAADNPRERAVLAPMVGIFHAIDSVMKAGAQVTEGQPVGSIESMKLLNDVLSNASGTVVEVLVDDGMPVEYGQPLCRIEVV
jgi:biotin carboxyl carrier protein